MFAVVDVLFVGVSSCLVVSLPVRGRASHTSLFLYLLLDALSVQGLPRGVCILVCFCRLAGVTFNVSFAGVQGGGTARLPGDQGTVTVYLLRAKKKRVVGRLRCRCGGICRLVCWGQDVLLLYAVGVARA